MAKLPTWLVCGLALALSGCQAEPLSPQDEARLKRIFEEMPYDRLIGVIQNLRYGGLYQGELSPQWQPTLATAINEAHFQLDFVDGRYDLSTDSGASAFLQDLSQVAIRQRLATELMTEVPPFTVVAAPGTVARREGRKCIVSGGTYDRNGEELSIEFYQIGRQVGIEFNWDGWPSSNFPRYLTGRFGDQEVPLLVDYEWAFSTIHADIFNTNGFWITDAMKRANELELGVGSEVAPLILPTGELYQTAVALEECSEGI